MARRTRQPQSSETKGGSLCPNFSSEYLLQQAVAGLLVRMTGISDVQILQSAQEYGKDVVFLYRGPMCESLPCACVIKNCQITGNVSSSTGARTVLNQVEQALDTPYTDGSGQQVCVQRVYVVTPHRVLPEAMNSIKGALQAKVGRVQFLDGDRLFGLFQKFWPDFLADEHIAVEQKLAARRDAWAFDEDLQQVGTLYNLMGAKRDARKIYVRPSFHRAFAVCDLLHVVTQHVPSQTALQIPPRPSKHRNDPGRPARPLRGNDLNRALASVCGNLDLLSAALTRLSDAECLTVPTEGRDCIAAIGQFKTDLRAAIQNATTRPGLVTVSATGIIDISPDFLRDLRENITRLLNPFSKEVSSLRTLLGNKHQWDASDFDDTNTRHLLHIEDCLRTLRVGGPSDYETSVAMLGKSLLESTSTHLLIVGPAGYGKTSFSRWHALLDAERYHTGGTPILPAYIALHRLRRKEIRSFRDFIGSTNSASAFGKQRDWDAVREGRSMLRLYLDGLDEVPEDADRRRLMEAASDSASFCPKCQCIVTARDTVEGPWLGWLTRVSLSGLEPPEQIDLARQWFDGDADRVQSFARDIKDSRALQEIMRVPLLATLTILVYMRTSRVPRSRAGLYHMFMDLLCGGWDLAKGVLRSSRFGREVKIMVLSRLAANVHRQRVREFGQSQVGEAAREILARVHVSNVDLLLKELLEDGIIVEAGRNIQFAHLSLQEFLAANDFHSDLSSARLREAIRSSLEGDIWWKEVVNFLIGLTANPRGFANVVASAIGEVSETRQMEILAEIDAQFPECGILEKYPHLFAKA